MKTVFAALLVLMVAGSARAQIPHGAELSPRDMKLVAGAMQKANEKEAAMRQALEKATEQAKRKQMVAGFVQDYRKEGITLVYLDSRKNLLTKQLRLTPKTTIAGKLAKDVIVYVKTAGATLKTIQVVTDAK